MMLDYYGIDTISFHDDNIKISQLEVLMSLNLNNKLYIMYQYLEVLMTTKYK